MTVSPETIATLTGWPLVAAVTLVVLWLVLHYVLPYWGDRHIRRGQKADADRKEWENGRDFHGHGRGPLPMGKAERQPGPKRRQRLPVKR